jgi:hypothetical protein
VATKRTTGASGSPAARPRRTPAAGARTLVYVYCIAQSASPPPLRVQGLPDAGPPRALPLGRSRWILVADVPASRFDQTALAAGLQDLDWMGACAMAHDALVMEAMKNGPVAPMRLFTIFEDEARALTQAQLASKQISQTLRRVAGRAEYGVRAGVMPAARRQARAPVPRLTGRSFLEQKRKQLEARRKSVGVPDAERQQIFDRLARLADEARQRDIPEGGSVWLDGAFLVPLSAAAAFRRAVNRLATELARAGHEVVLTGPWPPYSFLDHGATN